MKKNLNKIIVGIDEVGRGPLAGPVIAAAVTIRQIPNSKFQYSKHVSNFVLRASNLRFRDSKKLSPKKREKFYRILTTHPEIEWGIGRVSEKMIDKINIKNAAELAMEKALQNLKSKIKIPKFQIFLIIDGNNIKNLKLITYNLKLIVKGDEKVFSCAAASIIAKVTRDRIMERYHHRYPRYGFDKHKGYGTKFHFKMLKKYGPCKIHRKTFRPVKNLKLLK